MQKVTSSTRQNFATSTIRKACRRRLAAAAALAVIPLSSLCVRPAWGAARTWVGSTATDWAAINGFNAVPATGDSLIFGNDGTAGTSSSNVLANTLTNTAFSIAGITFNAGAPAYTNSGNSFTLTTGITNSSSNLQTFSNSNITGTPITPTSTAGLTTATGLIFTTGSTSAAGITLSGLQFTMTGTSGVTTTVNGTGTFTIGVLGLDIGAVSRVIQTFNGNAPIVVTTVNSGGSTSAGNNSFGYSGTGMFTLNGTANPATSYGDFVSSGTFVLNGSIAEGMTASGTGVFNESGTGVLSSGGFYNQSSTATSTLSGANTYTGATTLTAGTLVLDHSATGAPVMNIIGGANTALTLGGGTLTIKGNSGASNTNSDKFNGTSFTTLTTSKIIASQNGAGTLNLTLGGLTRGGQSTVDLTLPTSGTVSTTTTTATGTSNINGNGVAYSTANGGTTWLTNTSGTLGALPQASYQVDAFAASKDTDIQSNDSPLAFTNNTLRFNTASKTLTINASGTSTITAGGILVTPNGTGSVIGSGGVAAALTTGATGKEFVVQNYADLAINVPLVDQSTATTLTIAGTGVTALGAANTFTGQTALLGGTLKLTNQLALQNSTLQYNTGTSLVFDSSVAANAFSIGGLNTSNNIGLVNNAGTPAPITLTVGGNNSTTTMTGSFSGAGSLTKAGTGGFTLNANSTYTGPTTVLGGTLFLGSTFGITSNVTVGSGAFLSLSRNAVESAVLGGTTNAIGGLGGLIENINNPNQAPTQDRPNTYTGPTQFPVRGGFTAGVASTYVAGGTLYNGLNQTSGAFGVNSAIQMTGGGPILFLNGKNNQVGSLAGTSGNVYLGSAAGTPAAILTTGGDNTSTSFGVVISDTYLGNNSAGGSAVTIGGQIVKIGSGTQTFTANNLYAGATTIDGGTLSITTIANGGAQTTGSTSGASTTLTVTSTAGIVVGQTVLGAGIANATTTVTAIGAGTVTLSTAVTVPASSGLSFGIGNGIGTSANAASNLVLDGGALQYNGTTVGSTDRLFQIGLSTDTAAATGTLDSSSPTADTLTFSNAGPITFGKANLADNLTLTGTNTGANTLTPILGDNGSSAVSVTKNGVGTWVLTGANTYSGGTTVNAGTLTVGTGGTIGSAASPLAVNNPNTSAGTAVVLNLATGVNTTTGSLSGAIATPSGGTNTATINNGGSSRNFTVNQTTAGTFPGVIAGAGSFTLGSSSTNTLTLTGANTYSAGTTINAGTLFAGNTAALGATTGALNVGGGALDIGTFSPTVGAVALTSGTIQSTGSTTATLTGTSYGVQSGLISADLGNNSAALTKSTAGIVTLSGSNSYSGGTSINGGALAVGAANALGTTGAISFGGGTLQYANLASVQDYSSRFSTAASQAYSIDTNGQAVTFATPLTSSGGSLAVSNTSGTGSLTLTGLSTYTGATTINAGATLNLGDGTTDGSISSTSGVTNNGALNYNLIAGRSVNYTNGISGSGSVSLTSASGQSLTFAGANTYGGGTTVSSGTLFVSSTPASASGTGAGAVTVNGGTLGGAGGNIAGAVNVFAATLSPGTPSSQLATLSVGTTTLADTSTFVATLNSDTSTSGVGQASLLNVTGSIALGSTTGMTTSGATLVVNDLGSGQTFTAGTLYTIIETTTGITNTFNNLAEGATVTATNGSTYTVSYANNDVVLDSVTAPTPEPGSLGLLGVAGVMIMRRRRRNAAHTRMA